MDDSYIAQLAALPLQQIKDEPAALQQSALQLTQSLTALCHAHARQLVHIQPTRLPTSTAH